MKLCFAVTGYQKGRGYGYKMHETKLREALIEAGVEITFNRDEPYDCAVHIQRGRGMTPVPGKRNILFSQVEFDRCMDWDSNNLLATAWVTSSEHGKEVLSHRFPGPIEVCPLGIDPLLFPYYQRKAPAPGEPFIFLWMGNYNGSKGSALVQSAWRIWGEKRPPRKPKNCRLYLKFSGEENGGHKIGDEMVIDDRDLPKEQLAELYRSAHAFVYPSYGDGWSMVLSDAMATGLPSIWTHWSAPVDYADETTGYPITEFRKSPMWSAKDNLDRDPPRAWGMEANPDAIIARMEDILGNYDEALARGKRASERMHSRYTWRQSAQRFIEICERLMSMPLAELEPVAEKR